MLYAKICIKCSKSIFPILGTNLWLYVIGGGEYVVFFCFEVFSGTFGTYISLNSLWPIAKDISKSQMQCQSEFLKYSWRKLIYLLLLLISNCMCGFNSRMLHGRPLWGRKLSSNHYKFLLALQMTWGFLRGIPERIFEEFHSHLWPKTDRLAKMIMSCWLTIWDLSSSSIKMEFCNIRLDFSFFFNAKMEIKMSKIVTQFW